MDPPPVGLFESEGEGAWGEGHAGPGSHNSWRLGFVGEGELLAKLCLSLTF